jgi:hypothetical protein
MLRYEFAPYQDMPNQSIVEGFINRAANHEVKTVVSDVYFQQPGVLLRPVSVARTVTEWQGPEPAWKIPTKDIIQYNERSLEKGGIVEPGPVMGERGHEITGWAARATPDDLLVQRAMVGFFSSFGLELPTQSVQRLYRVGGGWGDGEQAPLVRHRLYDLLSNNTNEQSIESINATMTKEGHHPRTLRKKLEALEEEGIVEICSKSIGYNPSMKILNSEYSHVAIAFSDTSLETQAAYAAAQALGVDTTIGVDEFVDKAIEKLPDADPVKLRKYVIGSFNECANRFPGLQLMDRQGRPVTDLSVVKIVPEMRQAVNDLVSGVREILVSENLHSRVNQAEQIMSDPKKVNQLVAKAGEFSAIKAGHFHGRKKLKNQMKAILREAGPQDVDGMRVELLNRYGRMLGSGIIHGLLSEQVEAEAVSSTMQTIHPHSAITHKVYSLIL